MNSIAFINNFIVLLRRLGLLVLIFTISRAVFLLSNLNAFTPLAWNEVFKAFFFGIRFDLVVIYYLNILYLLYSLLLFRYAGKRWYEISGKTLFIIVNSILLLANVIDAGYFDFTNKRSGWEMLQMLTTGNNTLSLIPDYLMNYWQFTVIWISMVFILIRFFPEYRSYSIDLPDRFDTKYLLVPVSVILFMGLGFAVARGIEGKPIRMISANKYVSSGYVSLVLNTPFAIINTVNQYSIQERNYFPGHELSGIYSPVKHYTFAEDDFREKNVVLIILESFGKEYIDYKEGSVSFTPFLDSLFNEGLYFENAFANAFRSMDALPAVMAGFPSMMNTAYINSAYSLNTVSGLAYILGKEKNYRTAFFHGGNNGTMGFDIFSQAAGVEEYHGATEFNNDKFHDGAWGIFDEEFFQYANNVQESYDRPFFSVLFSLSSHDPYPIPERYKNNFPKGKLPILESIAYTDYALKRMFDSASQMPWYQNTLFIITADHTSIAIDRKYNTRIGKVRVPLFFFCPADTMLKGTDSRVVQHLDVMPSVLEYLRYDKPFVCFGKSVFNNGYRYSVNYDDVNYQIIDSTYTLLFDGENSIALYHYYSDPLMTENLLNKRRDIEVPLKRKLKAYIQNYTYRMNQNKLTDAQKVSAYSD